jgi:putative peptidoglycan lipid II flippase
MDDTRRMDAAADNDPPTGADAPADGSDAATPDGHARHAERERFFGAAKLVAGITLLSRFAGLARDLVQSWIFGAKFTNDAFNTAFAMPNFFRRLFGEGALSAAFVPVFSEIMELQGRQKAAALLANVLGLLGLVLALLCLLVEGGLLVAYLMTPDDNASRQLVLVYAGIMMPFMVTICLLALGSAALNCVGHFAYPAAAPIVLNLGIVAANIWLAPRFAGEKVQLGVVAASVVVSGLLQLVLLVWVLKAHNLPFIPRLFPVHPAMRKMLSLMLPMLIPLGLLQFNAMIDKPMALYFTATKDQPTLTVMGRTYQRPLKEGSVTEVVNAERLYQFPLGVLVTALGTAVFPLFSRYAARGEHENLRGAVNRALRLALFEGLPSGVGLMILAKPLMIALFVHRGSKYLEPNALEAAHVLRFYGAGVWAFCAQQILLRAFYAQKDTKTPLRVACALVGVNFLLNISLLWIPAIRQGAFGLSTTITGTVNVLILAVILKRRMGNLGLASLLTSAARTLLATGAMAAVVWAVTGLMTRIGLGGSAYLLCAGVPAGIAAFFLACVLLRAPEVKELLARGH